MQAKTLMCGLAAATLLSVGFAALPTQDAAASAAPSRAQRDFERIKALAGDWEAVGEAGESGDWNFRVSAGGSAVLETLFVGTEHEMLTVYHMEDGELVLTHYCALGNQPHMHAAADSPEGTIIFEATHVGNLGADDSNAMKKGNMRFLEDGGLQTNWSAFAGDLETGSVGFTLRRKKAGSK